MMSQSLDTAKASVSVSLAINHAKRASTLCSVVLLAASIAAEAATTQRAAVAPASRATHPTSRPSPAKGRLDIDGQFIKGLTLEGTAHDVATVSLDSPGPRVWLPVGTYYWTQVDLQAPKSGDVYQAYNWYDRRTGTISISQGKPARLKIGGPLTQTVTAERQGTNLVLNYELRGVAGERYTPENRTKPPAFAVYHNDRKIASGSFEFG
jgi:hypothetical protein